MAEEGSERARDILAGFKALFQSRVTSSNDPPGQKRKLTRMRCEYRVDCFLNKERFAGQVVDMSLTGMRLELTRPVKAGNLLSVKYDTASGYFAGRKFDVDTVHTRVMWSRKKKSTNVIEAGVSYTDSDEVMARSWVKFILKQLGFDIHGIVERRKFVRVRAMVAAVATPRGLEHDESDATVVNLGAGGCLLEAPISVRPGGKVELLIGPLSGNRPFKAGGRVLQCTKVPDTSRYSLRIQFEDMGAADVDMLGKYIALLLREAQ